MDTLMVLMMASLRAYCLDFYWDLPVAKRLDLMKESNWYLMMVKSLALYLEIKMESHLGLMLEQRWVL